jgi:hypothetical protein
MINKVDAIRSLFKGLYHKATADKIEWKDGHETTDEENSQIDAEFSRLQTEYDAQDYARKRKEAYPDIYDYMDGIVKNDQTQINKYIADSQAVKVRYPKG